MNARQKSVTPILLLVLLLGWGLRLYRLAGQSFWYDEGYAVYVAGRSPTEALFWSSRDVVPPLHTALLSLWLPLGGWNEFGARFLSAWMGALAVVALMRMATDLHTRRAGWIAGLLAAISPFYVWYSQDARMYATQAGLGFLATAVLIRALRRPERRRRWGAVALLDAMALYAQTTGGFQIAFHGLVVLAAALPGRQRWERKGERGWERGWERLRRGGGALACALIMWLPWVIYALPFWRQNAGYWPGQLHWSFILSQAWRGFVTGEVMPTSLSTITVWVWGLAGVGGLAALAALRGRAGWCTVLFLSAYFVAPMALMAWSFHHIPKFSPRYLILASPPVFLTPALGVAALTKHRGALRLVGISMLITLTATAALGLFHWYADPAFAKSDFRAAARRVQAEIAPDETVLLVPGHTFPVWQFYFGPTGWHALPDDPILDVRHVLHYRDVAPRLNAILAESGGVWLVEWEPWVADPTDIVVALLEQIGDEQPIASSPHGIRLRHYRLNRERLPLPTEPAVTATTEGATLDLPLLLRGCALPFSLPGDSLLVTDCYWQSMDNLPLHLSVSARLVDTEENEWGRADAPISGPYLVAGRWPTDQPVLGRYTVQPLAGIPPGDFYRLRLTLYEPDGTSHGMVEVTPVVIEPPAHPFTGTLESGGSALRLEGLTLEAVAIQPAEVLPGDEVRVEAIWRVDGPFAEPTLWVGDAGDVEGAEEAAEHRPLLPMVGATDRWRPGDRYRTQTRLPISPYALGGPTAVWVGSSAGQGMVGTVFVAITRTFALPSNVPPLAYRLGEQIALVGAETSFEEITVESERDETGGRVHVVLYWRSEALVETSYTVFVHLVGPDGRIYAQADRPPRNGRHPTTHWRPGEVVVDPYSLELPADAPEGMYRILAGMYDWTTGDRLPVQDAEDVPVPDGAIHIAAFPVSRADGHLSK